MRILWITNIPFPNVCDMLGIPKHVGGGWMTSLAAVLQRTENLQLGIASIYLGSGLQSFSIENVNYYLLPKGNTRQLYDAGLERLWLQIIHQFNPDLIHIHGTEYAHGLACMKASPNQKYVVSIQGMVSIYSKYYYAGIKFWELLENITFRDLRSCDSIFHGQRKFRLKGKLEHEYLKHGVHIIGRTSWDYAHTQEVNPHTVYHKCNEVLRPLFYISDKWTLPNVNKYSVFVSQAGYPIKGLHQILRAIAIVRNYFPEVSLRVAGIDITYSGKHHGFWNLDGYGLYIKRLIKNLSLQDCITFTGPLEEEKMVQEFQTAHIFVCPSSIENSPNSIGEAQIIGTPCIASFVGGIPDMISHERTGLLYPFEEYSMLASQIIRIFNNNDLAQSLSSAEIVEAESRHNRVMIRDKMISIYHEIIER